MGGIETWRDAAEFIAMGCSTVQVTTAVMQYGYRIIEDMIDGLSRYLTEKGYHSVAEMQGKALSHIVGTDELDRSGISFPNLTGNCAWDADGATFPVMMEDTRQSPLIATVIRF